MNTFFAIGMAIILTLSWLTRVTNSFEKLVTSVTNLVQAIVKLIEVIKKLIAKK